MKVRDIYEKRLCYTIYKVIGYYNGAEYGFLNKDTENIIFDMEVKAIGIDTFNGNEKSICIMVE